LQRIKKVEMAIFRPLVKLSAGLDGKGTFLNFIASSNAIISSADFSISGEVSVLDGVGVVILEWAMVGLRFDLLWSICLSKWWERLSLFVLEP
jgi:hypothetical protein